MRDNGPITTQEVSLPEGTLLVSQTDTGGRITFANDAFVAASGFTRADLIGAPHNLVRHPHMPQAAFRDLWETVRSGWPWAGAAMAGVAALVTVTSLLSVRRMRRAVLRIEEGFGALARGDLEQAIGTVPVPELRMVSGFLRSLRARMANAEEVRAQRERDATKERVVALQEMASKVEAAANRTAEEVTATAAAMPGNANGLAEAVDAVSAHAGTAARAAGEALSGTQAVAGAAEELAGSIREITTQISHATDVTRGAVEESDAAQRGSGAAPASATEWTRSGRRSSLSTTGDGGRGGPDRFRGAWQHGRADGAQPRARRA